MLGLCLFVSKTNISYKNIIVQSTSYDNQVCNLTILNIQLHDDQGQACSTRDIHLFCLLS